MADTAVIRAVGVKHTGPGFLVVLSRGLRNAKDRHDPTFLGESEVPAPTALTTAVSPHQLAQGD